jgi:N-acetylmuramoyl-L-alanine amidase
MNLVQHYLTKNDCYKAGEHITVKGLMLHSTGANNPNLSRYIDDPALGPVSSSHWNQPKPGGREVCVHGFIGKDGAGNIKSYNTLPWNMRGWHAGGSANNTHISTEICEDDLQNPVYFAAVYQEAVELFAYLCKQFNLTEKNIITHSEGHKLGIASNHADVMHWFPKHGKSMDTFRADVKVVLNQAPVFKPNHPAPAPTPAPVKSIDELAHEVIKGTLGSGAQRKAALGAQYGAVQARVNEILGGVSKPEPTPVVAPTPVQKSVDELAQQVIKGTLGSGDTRRKALGARYDEVQARVNEILGGGSKPAPVKSVHDLALEVIKGLHGSGAARKASLGAQYDAVQKEVNRIL